MLIAVTYGHIQGGGAHGIRAEFDMIREYGPLLVKYLREQGHTVDVISKYPGKDYLSHRCKEENKKDYDMCLDLHINAFNSKAHGSECIYYPTSKKGKEIATKINNELIKLGFSDRGAYPDRRGLYMLKHTNSPCVIVEPCFCDNEKDMKLYDADKIARAIVKGITGQEIKSVGRNQEFKNLDINSLEQFCKSIGYKLVKQEEIK